MGAPTLRTKPSVLDDDSYEASLRQDSAAASFAHASHLTPVGFRRRVPRTASHPPRRKAPFHRRAFGWMIVVGTAPRSGPTSMDEARPIVNQQSPAELKIRLFRSLFRGREDVYPRRFESRRTGKSGYAPACSNEWVRGICEKPRIKCADCQHRRFLPVNDEVIRWHLSGEDAHREPFVAGVYPLLLDESCYFLAVDFDKANWQDDAAAFLEVCQRLDLPAALERSRSGRGGHVWLFFEQAIPAALARRLGSHLLTETMEGRPDVGLDSYDRLFPNQDTLPQGGFGNLIALPLQKGPREHGHSVFLDERFVPWADQWAFLSSIPKVGRVHVEHVVHDAERRGRILGVRLPPQEDGEEEPWTAPPSRRRVEPPITGDLPVNVGAGPREPDLHRQGRAASWHTEPPPSTGSFSES